MSVPHLFPDSRLAEGDSTLGSQIVDWEMPDGSITRLEVVPIFCGSCGKPYGFVPKDNCAFVCWLCRPCHEKYGVIAGTYAQPDDEFCKAVEHEMIEKFGRALTEAEIGALAEKGELGRPLELLEKESPYPVYRY